MMTGGAMASETVYDFKMNDIDGKPVSLSSYQGKVLLFVNTASKCGFTPQYKSLETLYAKYKDRGFVILGFPANDFMRQEPGSDADIKSFCSLKYNVTFPMFSKTSVKGKEISPLYAHLTTRQGMEGDISWNFNKILVDRQGRVVARFGSKTDPLSDELAQKIEGLL
jgi:glutathione peroxidase-family protein